MEEQARPPVGRRLHRPDWLEAARAEARDQLRQGLVHLERDVVEPGPTPLEEPLDRASGPERRDQLELVARPEAADGDTARHLVEPRAAPPRAPRPGAGRRPSGTAIPTWSSAITGRRASIQTTVEAAW